jgi:translocation and assembly module TamB
LGAFRPRFGAATLTGGAVRGEIKIGGSAARPRAEGALEFRGAHAVFAKGWRPAEDASGKLAFDGTSVSLAEARARIGGGTADFSGRLDFKDPANLRWKLACKGGPLRIHEGPDFAVTVAPDLAAEGDSNGGLVNGSAALDGSAVLRGLVVIPRFGGLPPDKAPAASAPLSVARPPFAAWKLDVTLPCNGPVPVGKDGGGGALVPQLRLSGTAGEPLVLGTVRTDRLAVDFPAARLDAQGAMEFTAETPWRPVLDLTASGMLAGHEVRASASGPLGRCGLKLSSVPPLPERQLVVLLSTGVGPSPSSLSPRGIASSAPSQGFQLSVADPSAAPPVPENLWRLSEGAVGFDWTLR